MIQSEYNSAHNDLIRTNLHVGQAFKY